MISLFFKQLNKQTPFHEFLRFGLVGGSGIFIDLGTVILCKEVFLLDTRLAGFAGFTAATLSNFFLHRHWSFQHGKHGHPIKSLCLYLATGSFGLTLRLFIIHIFISSLHIDKGYGYLISNSAGISAAMILNFFGAKHIAFKKC